MSSALLHFVCCGGAVPGEVILSRPPYRWSNWDYFPEIGAASTWGVYAGERILVGAGDSFRDDLGVKIREMFEAGAREALASGEAASESFVLPRVRITIELLEPEASG